MSAIGGLDISFCRNPVQVSSESTGITAKNNDLNAYRIFNRSLRRFL